MPELRKNVVTGELVIVAPERARRPTDAFASPPSVPAYAEGCPFCPGHESETPPPTHVGELDGTWATRVVPNKFSALAPDGAPEPLGGGLTPRGGAAGPHEVIIEGQDHGARLGGLRPAVRACVLETWQLRMADFYRRPAVEHVVLFKNHGPAAGGSLAHPHSQIVGLPAVPGRFDHRRRIAEAHRRDHGRCLLCDVVAAERAEGARVVAETDEFIALVPFAAFSPLHVWIAPKRHAVSFAEAPPALLAGLDAILAPVLRAVDEVGAHPDYNLVFLGGPPGRPPGGALHWYIAVVGRTTKAAGFELGTGMYINPSSPEAQAERLRAAAAA